MSRDVVLWDWDTGILREDVIRDMEAHNALDIAYVDEVRPCGAYFTKDGSLAVTFDVVYEPRDEENEEV